ncbi:MAG: c-type cytochrome [Deltaproteobacteria bacterium]|nr:c-type cytochrome [Deltaproteobacteria bacterium]
MTEEDKLLEHDYDGIQEYDNDLPRWWRNIFWLTGIFGVFYLVWTHFGFKEPQHQQLAREIQELEQHKAEIAKSSGSVEVTDEQLMKLVAMPERISKGKEIFVAKCAACHGINGEGLVGPNLTDDFWIHGGKPTQIRKVIMEGVPEKGMISWQALMTADEINSALAYIWSLNGTSPPNGKAPEGDEFKRS